MMKCKSSILNLFICSLFLAVCSSACHDESQHKVEEANNKGIEQSEKEAAIKEPKEENKASISHDWKGWLNLGTKTVEGWTMRSMQKGEKLNGKLYADLEVEVTPPKGSTEIVDVVRAWMGDKDSESLKTKLNGHSHGGATMAYYYPLDFTEDEGLTFTVQVKTESGKEIFTSFTLQ